MFTKLEEEKKHFANLQKDFFSQSSKLSESQMQLQQLQSSLSLLEEEHKREQEERRAESARNASELENKQKEILRLNSLMSSVEEEVEKRKQLEDQLLRLQTRLDEESKEKSVISSKLQDTIQSSEKIIADSNSLK